MWPFLSIVLSLGCLLIHLFWRGRWQGARSELGRLRRELADLSREQADQSDLQANRQVALFNSMVEGVLILDASNRVQLVNKSFRRLFGVPHEIAGQTLMESLRMHELNQLVERLHQEGRVTEAVLHLKVPQESTFQVNAVSLSDRSGNPGGAMLVFHDLTRVNQLENTRREFVANVSHELRTPLSMIKGYLETLLDGAMNEPVVAEKFLRTIDKHADRLTFLIEDLLTISRLESGQVVINHQPMVLSDLVDRVREDLADRAQERNITVESLIPDLLEVRADPARLQQVFFNLVDNAIKYGLSGGRVLISSEAVEEGFVKISVEDDGPGIPAESLERVFERFYRVDKARSREQGGTGLGLAIVKHIVQAHGGEVWVESPPGEGARFCFTLPAAA